MYGVREIEIRNAEHVRQARDGGFPVMFVVNHPAHGDPFVTFEVMHRLRMPCCYLAAWQVFTGWLGLRGFVFQRLGAFSVDREGTDLRSFRTAVDILAEGRYGLVIYPEGDVYHLNDRITPFREGAATIALAADRRRRKSDATPVRIVPCAVKYFYLEDPTPILDAVMTRIERRLYRRPRPDTPLPDRVYRVAEGLVALVELEHMQELGRGTLPDRLSALTGHVLDGMEQRRLGRRVRGTVPERVKTLRQDILKSLPEDAPAIADHEDLDALHLVTQLSSYPGDYLARTPSIERIAETIDKLEEDALGAEDAGARVPRRAVVSFGEALELDAASGGQTGRAAAAPVTACIEQALQEQLDSMIDQ